MEILGQQDVSAIYLPFKTMLNTFRYYSYQFNTLGLFFFLFFFFLSSFGTIGSFTCGLQTKL